MIKTTSGKAPDVYASFFFVSIDLYNVGVWVNLSGELESNLRGLDLNTPNAQELY